MEHRKDIKKASMRQEKRAAADLGGRLEAASGATRFGGGDVRKVRELRVECKFTSKPEYTLKRDELEKLRVQAIKGGLEEPIFQFAFRGIGERMDEYGLSLIFQSQVDVFPNACVMRMDGKSITFHQEWLRRTLLERPLLAVRYSTDIGAVFIWRLERWADLLDRRMREEEE